MDPADPRGTQREPSQQKTDLEVWLRVRGPEMLRKNASNIILGVLIVAAVVMFFVSRSRSKAANADALAQTTAQAYDLASQARTALLGSPVRSPEANRERQQAAQRAVEAADQILAAEDASSSQRAVALLSKAEVFWALANAPADALATSQPVMGFPSKPKEAYLADAEAAYTEILSKHTEIKPAVGNALLGLAAIAENRRNWADAEKWYSRAAEDASLAAEFRDLAKTRQTILADLRRPFALAEPSTQPGLMTDIAAPVAPRLPSFIRPTTAPTDGIPMPSLFPSIGGNTQPTPPPAPAPTPAPFGTPSLAPTTAP